MNELHLREDDIQNLLNKFEEAYKDDIKSINKNWTPVTRIKPDIIKMDIKSPM